MYEKIVQIMPAPKGFYATYEGSKTTEIICIGLTEDGGVCFMDYDEEGNINIVNEFENFVRVVKLNARK